MSFSRKRAMTLTLVALGIFIVGLGAALIATFPWPQNAAQAGPMVGPGSVPGPGPWYGNPPRWGFAHGGRFFHGPWFFGGGLVFAVALAVLVGIAAGRWRREWYDGHDERPSAEEILRRTFAEGRITEEQFRRMRGILESGA